MAREPTNGSAVPQRLLQLADERRRGTDGRTNQLPFFRKSEVEGNLCGQIEFRTLNANFQLKPVDASGTQIILRS